MGKEVVEMGDKIKNLWKMCASHNLLALSVFFLLTIKMIFLKVRYVASLPKTPNLRSDWYGGSCKLCFALFSRKTQRSSNVSAGKDDESCSPKNNDQFHS